MDFRAQRIREQTGGPEVDLDEMWGEQRPLYFTAAVSAEVARQLLVEAREAVGRRVTSSEARGAALRFRSRVLDYLLEQFQSFGDVPHWDEMTGEERPAIRTHEGGPIAWDFVSDSVREFALRDERIYAEFWRRRDAGEAAGSLIEEIRQRETVALSKKRIEQIVYPRRDGGDLPQ